MARSNVSRIDGWWDPGRWRHLPDHRWIVAAFGLLTSQRWGPRSKALGVLALPRGTAPGHVSGRAASVQRGILSSLGIRATTGGILIAAKLMRFPGIGWTRGHRGVGSAANRADHHGGHPVAHVGATIRARVVAAIWAPTNQRRSAGDCFWERIDRNSRHLARVHTSKPDLTDHHIQLDRRARTAFPQRPCFTKL